MGQLPVFIIIIVMIIAANLIAQKVFPTRVSHGFRRQLNYRGAVWFITIGLLLLVLAVAAVFNL